MQEQEASHKNVRLPQNDVNLITPASSDPHRWEYIERLNCNISSSIAIAARMATFEELIVQHLLRISTASDPRHLIA